MVDPAAGTRLTGQSVPLHLTSQSSLRLFPPGGSVRVFVDAIAADGSVTLRVGAHRIAATTAFPLRPGAWYTVHPRSQDGRIELRLDAHLSRARTTAEIVRSSGLPADAVSDAVVRAFLRSGLPLQTSRLRKVYARVRSLSKEHRRSVEETARITSLAERKGLDLDGEALGGICSVAGRHPGDYHGGSRGRGQSGGRDRGPMTPGKCEKMVRESFRLSSEAEHPLQLFNHIVGEGDHWVIVPIVTADSTLAATLRIRIPRAYALGTDRSGGSVREAVLVVTSGVQRLQFGIQPSGDGWRLSVPQGGFPGNEREFDALRGHLAALGVEIGRPRESDAEDGFSHGAGSDIIMSVDSSI